jgi:hypothetical protein
MTLQRMLLDVVNWFNATGGGSLRLPSGCFGRPFDNQHRLSDSRLVGSQMVLVLDGMQKLTITSPKVVRAERDLLCIVGSDAIEWRWREYGTNHREHVDSFTGGELEFHAPVIRLRTATT